jgi:hypothetical protein
LFHYGVGSPPATTNEAFTVFVDSEPPRIFVQFGGDDDALHDTTWVVNGVNVGGTHPGVTGNGWRMMAITCDVDGGTGADPLFTFYDFEAETGHQIRTQTWDPAVTPQALGTYTADDIRVGIGAIVSPTDTDSWQEMAHQVVIGSVLTAQNLIDIATLGIDYQEFTTTDYPQVLSVTETENDGGTSHTLSLPATVDEQDLLIMLVSYGDDDTQASGFPSDWTQIQAPVDSSNVVTTFVYAKVADGTEDGGTFDFSTTASALVQGQCYRIDAGTHYGITDPTEIIEAGTAVLSTGSPNPPSLTASWGSDWNLFIAMCGIDTEPTISSYLTDYTDGQESRGGAGGSTASTLGSARLESVKATDDPGAFTPSAGDDYVANTLVIRPEVSVPVTPTAAFITSLSPDYWLDAMDTTSLWQESTKTTNVAANGDPVEAWDDQTANGRDFTNANSTLEYQTAGFNGLPCVRSSNTGVNDILVTAAAWSHGTPCTILLAFRNDDASGNKYVAQQGAGGTIRVFFAADAGTGTGPGFYDGASHKAFGTAVENDEDAFAIVFGGDGNARMFQQNTKFGSDTAYTSFSQTEEARIFGGTTDMDIAELIFINRELTVEEREAGILYLVTKWGL